MSWLIEPLGPRHVRQQFRCGRGQLDEYIRRYAGQHERKHIGRTFVAVHPGETTVVGYYTLSASSVAFENMPEELRKKLPKYPLPVALIGKLAVDKTAQGRGLGQTLLVDALKRVARIADQMAILAVEVHAIDERATQFYQKYGFQQFHDHSSHLFLPLATFRSLDAP